MLLLISFTVLCTHKYTHVDTADLIHPYSQTTCEHGHLALSPTLYYQDCLVCVCLALLSQQVPNGWSVWLRYSALLILHELQHHQVKYLICSTL